MAAKFDGSSGTSGVRTFLQRAMGFILLAIVLLVIFGGTFGTISTGNVGVRTTLGIMNQQEVTPGVYMKWPLISKIQEFSAKEIAIDLTDLTPKAKDNLSLRDMDISVYYRAEPQAIAELVAKYAGQSVPTDEGDMMPAFNLVYRVARNAAYEEVAKVDSLVMHTRREELGTAMHDSMQQELDRTDPNVFKITRVVIRAVATDPSIEQSIRDAVANQKKLEAMEVQTKIAQREAEIKVTEAKGIAEANRIISGSLTREYLQHEANQALLKFAQSGNTSTVIMPAGMSMAPLINVNASGGEKK